MVDYIIMVTSLSQRGWNWDFWEPADIPPHSLRIETENAYVLTQMKSSPEKSLDQGLDKTFQHSTGASCTYLVASVSYRGQGHFLNGLLQRCPPFTMICATMWLPGKRDSFLQFPRGGNPPKYASHMRRAPEFVRKQSGAGKARGQAFIIGSRERQTRTRSWLELATLDNFRNSEIQSLVNTWQ